MVLGWDNSSLALVAQLVEKFDDFPRHFLQICWFFGSGNPVLAM
jgi:hypothetical protein